MKKPLRIVLIGAASPQWGYTLTRDLLVTLSHAPLYGRYAATLVLADVDGEHLKVQAQLARKIQAAIGKDVRIESTTVQKQAIEGADFVICSLAQGTLEAMQPEIDIPREYGIVQPVGDTVSIGGAIRAARNIPAMLSIARDMEACAAPGAWLLNLSNPMSTLCRAVTRYSRVRTIGCCHELYGAFVILGGLFDRDFKDWRQHAKIDALGINHCAWMQRFEYDGVDMLAKLKTFIGRKGITPRSKRLYDSPHPELTPETLKMALFLKHGVFPYSGDRHNAEFFREYLNAGTNNGADYGILCTTVQERLVSWRGGKRVQTNRLLSGKEALDLKVSQEAASRIITALLTGEPFFDVGNLPYHDGTLPGVPDGAVIERMVTYGKDGAIPQPVKPLPKPVQAHLALHLGIVEDVVEASVTGNRQQMKQALERDPLLQNMKRNQVGELLDRLLLVNRRFVHRGFF